MPGSHFLAFDYLILPSNGFLRFFLSIFFFGSFPFELLLNGDLRPVFSTPSVGSLFSVAPFDPFLDCFFRFILSDR